MKELDHFALITGFSGGIGREIALVLAKSGINILGHYGSNEIKANELKEEGQL